MAIASTTQAVSHQKPQWSSTAAVYTARLLAVDVVRLIVSTAIRMHQRVIRTHISF